MVRIAALIAVFALPVAADTAPVTYVVENSLENVTFAVESAIVGAGLVIESC